MIRFPAGGISIGWLGLLGVVLAVTFGSRIALAEPAALDSSPDFAAPVAQAPSFDDPSESATPPVSSAPLTESALQGSLENLLSVPNHTLYRSDAQIADQTIAAAVAQGPRPELEKQSGFRKKKHDLFRTERPIEIADQEMVLRLRLRAKLKRAMSVELRF